MSEHVTENGAAAPAPSGYMPPAEQQILFYRQRIADLTDQLTQSQLQIQFQAGLIQGFLTAQAEGGVPVLPDASGAADEGGPTT